MPEAQDRRKAPRIPVRSAQVTLQEQHSGEPLGAVANLSAGGLLVNSKTDFAVNATHQVLLSWRLPGSEAEGSMQIGITAMWSAPSDTGGAGWTGFQIIDISDEDRQRLLSLVTDETV